MIEEVSWATLFTTLKWFFYGDTAPIGPCGNYQDCTWAWKELNRLPHASLQSYAQFRVWLPWEKSGFLIKSMETSLNPPQLKHYWTFGIQPTHTREFNLYPLSSQLALSLSLSLYIYIYIYFFFLSLAVPHGLWDLSSPNRDWNHTLSSESSES